MTITQSDLDSFHYFATHLLARAGGDLSLEELLNKWRNEREQVKTIESIRRGVSDAESDRAFDLADVDTKIRSELGFPPRSR